jgi:hypothetical protein
MTIVFFIKKGHDQSFSWKTLAPTHSLRHLATRQWHIINPFLSAKLKVVSASGYDRPICNKFSLEIPS